MNVLAVVGSPRKGKATDTLIKKAIDGVKSVDPECNIRKLHLMDYDIKYCRNCLACRDSITEEPIARCSIRDDMDDINEYILNSNSLIFGTPVHSASVTAPMMTFLERISWTFAKPGRQILTIKGAPTPRSDKKRKAIIIVVSGSVPPIFRRFCDDATPLLKSVLKYSLNAEIVGDMYAGDIEHRGVKKYFDKAYILGKKIV